MKEIKIQVFGSGCPTCKTLYERVSKVSKEVDDNLEVEYITDITKMVKLGVMSAPVFAIDNQVVTSGQMPEEDEIKNAILEKLNS